MAGESTTTAIPIQVINDNTVATVPSACTSLGADLGSVTNLKANGILGVGYFKRDCGSTCTTASNTVYYTCSPTCSTVGILAADQVPNPVTQFGVNWNGASDNNGVIVSLPAISSAGAANVSGTLTFGVNTQANNQLGTAQVLPVDKPTGLLYTYFDSQYLCNSAIDTGSNNLNFPQGTTGLPLCTSAGNTNFYCPASLTNFPATIYGVDATYKTTSFDVANTDSLSSSNTAFNDIAANLAPFITSTKSWCPSGGTNGSFIWGLPFFFGKNVFVVFDGDTVNSSTGPFIAF